MKGRSGVRSCSSAGRFAERRKLAEEGAVARVIDCGIAAAAAAKEGRKGSRSSPEFARLASERGWRGRGRVESIQERAMFSFNSPNGQHRFTESHCTGWVGSGNCDERIIGNGQVCRNVSVQDRSATCIALHGDGRSLASTAFDVHMRCFKFKRN